MIAIRDCSRHFTVRNGQTIVHALDNLTLSIPDREFVVLLGPSGCGKTTLLKIVAGLLLPTSGSVTINGLPVVGPGPDRAVVFQQFALMPWADVLTNVAFGLELKGIGRNERESRAMALIESVGLAGFEKRYPAELSGGMQQRVGLARALAVDPEILLLDEPFGALDAQTRRLMQEDLLRMHEAQPKTVIFVTHSMEEAVRLADRIVVMSARPGRVSNIVEVPWERPRPENLERDPLFIALVEQLWEQLRTMQIKN
jgi:ABC-type nitrate/sulfonate/bicarbonate transport system ATPase subunit